MAEKPLSGIVVLDLTRYLAGPYCTLLLAGLGADVIKIEPPGHGDLHRRFPPFIGPRGAASQPQSAEDMGVLMLHRARNKKSITLNLYHPEGRALFKALCRKADVVVENYSPGVMDEMGVNYAALRELNPGLILCSISGFGQTGPLRDWRAYDPVIQSMSGIASVTGYADRPPARCGAAISDTVAPLFAVIGILAALRRREQSGAGEWVDIAMLDTSFFLQPDLLELLNGGIEPRRRGNTHAVGTPLNTYPTRDGFVTVAVTTDKNWQCLLSALGREDFKAEARFATPVSRRAHVPEIDEMVAEWLRARTTAEAVAVLQRHEVPAGPVHTLPELLTHPQLQARQMVVDLAHPAAGPLPGVKGFGMPIRFVEHPVHFDQPAPLLGAHNAEVYGTLLGISPATLAELQDKGVI
ncbi:MAG TPA: CoA transferase [Candidatus Binatia bacterium]|nr:CoA transferase [Candidatus Binatia bacterium]